MKHTLKHNSPTQVLVTVTLDADDLKVAKGQAVAHLAPNVKAAGFRKGKVPAKMAEKFIDPSALASETAEHAMNIALNVVASEKELRILDRPEVDIKSFEPYDSLNFEATIEILPDVKLGDYKKLKTKKDKVTVTKPDIDKVLDRMLTNMAEKEEVTRAAKNTDEVVIDFVGVDKDDKPVDGAAGTDYPLTLGSGTFIPGFEEGIVGHKVGDVFDLPLTFPKDYHSVNLKGAKVTFKTTIKKVTGVKLPKIDDALAQKVGPFKDVAELNDDIKREIKVQKDKEVDDKLKDDLIGELIELSTVPTPQILIDDQMQSIEQDSMQNLMYRGMTPEQYMDAQGYKDQAEWREKEFKVAAERRVKAGLVLAELSKLEKIEVTPEELSVRHEQMHKEYPNMKDDLDKPEARRDLANRILTEKTLDRLIELNT